MRNNFDVPRYPYAPPNNNKLPPSHSPVFGPSHFSQNRPRRPTRFVPNIQMPLVGIVCMYGEVFFESLARISPPYGYKVRRGINNDNEHEWFIILTIMIIIKENPYQY